jgi:probable F420-dependent oxidoreductase
VSGSYGVALNVAAGYLDEAAEVAALGYGAIWLPGGQLDRLDPIAELVRSTESVLVGTAVISLDVYQAGPVARLYAELEAEAPGRFLVGLGGPQQPRPLAALNAYLDELDRADPPVTRRILAALGPRKLELARDRCAGAVPLLVTPGYTATARELLGDEALLVIDQMVVLDDDAERARETARGPVRFLSGIGGYRANFTRMGFSDAEVDGLSDRLIDSVVSWGNAEAVASQVGEHLAAGADQVMLQVLHGDRQPGPLEAARELAPLLLKP